MDEATLKALADRATELLRIAITQVDRIGSTGDRAWGQDEQLAFFIPIDLMHPNAISRFGLLVSSLLQTGLLRLETMRPLEKAAYTENNFFDPISMQVFVAEMEPVRYIWNPEIRILDLHFRIRLRQIMVLAPPNLNPTYMPLVAPQFTSWGPSIMSTFLQAPIMMNPIFESKAKEPEEELDISALKKLVGGKDGAEEMTKCKFNQEGGFSVN